MAEQPDPADLDAARAALLDALNRHGVEFVLIGGAAIQSHGEQFDTLDVDVTPSTDAANLERLASALNELDCRLVTDPADEAAWVTVPSGYFDGQTLRRATVWNLATRYGQLDITFAPSGFPEGYVALAKGARASRAAGTTVIVQVAALEDVRHSKRAANRPKDRRYLESLE